MASAGTRRHSIVEQKGIGNYQVVKWKTRYMGPIGDLTVVGKLTEMSRRFMQQDYTGRTAGEAERLDLRESNWEEGQKFKILLEGLLGVNRKLQRNFRVGSSTWSGREEEGGGAGEKCKILQGRK